MGRVICLLVCTLTPLLAEPVGSLAPAERFLLEPASAFPEETTDSPEFSWLAVEPRFTPEAGWHNAALSIKVPEFSEREVPVLDTGTSANLGNSVALATTIIMIAVFLREYFRSRRYCLEYEELKEHLAIATRQLENARGRWLMRAYEDAVKGTGELGLRAKELKVLKNGISLQRRSTAIWREQEILKEHVALAVRDLDAARMRWLRAAQTGCDQVAGEFERREQELETLKSGIAAYRASTPSHLREYEDLSEHLILATSHVETARARWFMEAFLKASQNDSEVAAWEDTVNLLTARIEDHCHVHDCRTGSVPAESFKRALA